MRSPLRIALLTGLSALLPVAAAAQDADADGTPDAADVFPCDAARAGIAYAPAEAEVGLLLFEDQWPSAGDLDFNDVALSYHYVYELDAAGRVVTLRATYQVLALGGQLDHGLALTLPVGRDAVASATRRIGASAPTALVPLFTASNAELTLVDDLRTLFAGRSGPINSTGAPVGAPAIEIEIAFATPVTLPAAQAPHDLYVFRAGVPQHQIHRTPYGGSSRMNAGLFGTGDDASRSGRFFVETTGVPFVLELPANADYPAEGVAISALYPRILDFAASGGTTDADFYASGVNVASAYPNRLVAAAPALSAPDRSCAARPGDTAQFAGPSCAAIRAAGNTASAVYWVDPDGAGGLAPYQAYCEQTWNGGGWMLVIANRQERASTRTIEGPVTPNLTQSAVNDARWQYLRNNANEAMATFGSTRIVARMSALRNANCTPLAQSLTAPMLAHAENSGCSGTGVDYSLWFGYRNSWSRANAIYDHSRFDFYSSGPVYNNPDPASMWVR